MVKCSEKINDINNLNTEGVNYYQLTSFSLSTQFMPCHDFFLQQFDTKLRKHVILMLISRMYWFNIFNLSLVHKNPIENIIVCLVYPKSIFYTFF
jgi:hypothetical protein